MAKNLEIQQDHFLENNLKALLQDKILLLEERLQKKRIHSTYKNLTHAETRILATLRGEELTIAEISRRLSVSRQAVHKIIAKLVKRKLLKLEAIEGNARDKRIVFTTAGKKMKQEAKNKLRELEQEVKSAIGAHRFQLLKSILEERW